jgi:tRNA threonylcarbamoyladenosine biosynthesis protein TsaB
VNVLAFDTATAATVVGLAVGDELHSAADDPGPGERPRHNHELLALARSLLDRAGLSFADLDRIGVGTGPGSFTGLRIGVATARALAQANDTELVAVSTLRALAVAAGEPAVLAVVDARRGEVFAAAWRAGEPVLAPRALAPEALADWARTSGETWLGVGDGAIRFSDQLVQAGVTVPEPASAVHRLDPATLCRLAVEAEPAPRDAVVPEYLRLPDAEQALRTRSEGR